MRMGNLQLSPFITPDSYYCVPHINPSVQPVGGLAQEQATLAHDHGREYMDFNRQFNVGCGSDQSYLL